MEGGALGREKSLRKVQTESSWQRVGSRKKGEEESPRNRGYKTEEYTTRRWAQTLVLKRFKVRPCIDAFASEENRRFPQFWDEARDVLSQTWTSDMVLWMNPPWSAWTQAAKKTVRVACFSRMCGSILARQTVGARPFVCSSTVVVF